MSTSQELGCKGEVHLVSYRAIEAVMTNNPSMQCFRSIDSRPSAHRRPG